MKIKVPYINLQQHFPAIAAVYDAMAAEYNTRVTLARESGNKSMQYLKSAHRELYFDCIRAIKGDLARNIIIFKGTPSLLEREVHQRIAFFSNRKRASERTKKSEATIYRLIQRLIDAGIVIEKINHGTQRDYELIFAPEMILISDYNNESFDPVLYFSKNAENKAVREALRSICTPCSSNMNILKNGIITMNIHEHGKVSASQMTNNEHTRTFYENTGDSKEPAESLTPELQEKINTSVNTGFTINLFGHAIANNSSGKINTSKTEEYSQRLKQVVDRDKQRTRSYAVRLVEMIISVLFSTRNIYNSEREKAYAHGEYYFKNLNSAMDCDKAYELYVERIRLVQNYLERNKDFNFTNIWPAHYLDPENTSSGFIKTGQWLKKHKEFQELQMKTRKLKTEESIVTYAVNRMIRWKNPSSFQYWRSYVINKAPNRVADYELRALAVLHEK